MATFSLPAHYRTWQFQVGQAIAQQAGVALTNGRGLRLIKDSMLGTGSWTDAANSPVASSANWTVVSSCSGAGGAGSFGNNDNVDRWAADANVIWANPGANHSWTVLRQTGIAGTYYLCIDCAGTQTERLTFAWSSNLFTGGTATARPTSSNEASTAGFPFASSAQWGGPSTNVASVFHAMKSADGRSTRIVLARNGFAAGLWSFEALEMAPAAWTNPAVATIFGSATGAIASTFLTQANFASAGQYYSSAQLNGLYPAFALNYLAFYGSNSLVTIPTVANDMASAWPMFRFGSYVPNNVSLSSTVPIVNGRGNLGQQRDIWWVQSQLGEGDYFPAAGTKNYVILGDICLPWNTTTITLT